MVKEAKWLLQLINIIHGYPKNFGFISITLFPFIFVIDIHNVDNKLINHEKIHLAQYKELFVFGFLILYFFYWLKNLIFYRNLNLAYKLNPFEQEAYSNEKDLSYLNNRKKFSWKKFTN